MACEVWPEPRSKTGSTSSPFFSKIFASLASHGIQRLGDKVDTPQWIFFKALSCAPTFESRVGAIIHKPATRTSHDRFISFFSLTPDVRVSHFPDFLGLDTSRHRSAVSTFYAV